jgi:threonine aldolase
MNFASDNWAGVPPEVAHALSEVNVGVSPGYGSDEWTAAVERRIGEVFGRPVSVFFVATGSAANALALSALVRPGALVLAADEAHIRTDECNAPEFLTSGAKMVGLSTEAGRIVPASLSAALDRYPPNTVHLGRPDVLSLTQATELGTVYTAAEIAALAATAKARGLSVHMDGARFSNAVARLGADPADLTWKAGVDVLSFGLTKTGAWAAEAVVFFDPERGREFGYTRKRAGHLFSKSRFVAAQFDALLRDGLWLRLAAHANAMADRLADGLSRVRGVRLPFGPGANAVFAILPKATLERLQAAGARLYPWSAATLAPEDRPAEGEVYVRLVTSFATRPEEIDDFLEIADRG